MVARTKAEARAQGVTSYFTGRPCNRGHYEKRWTSSGMCEGCRRVSMKKCKTKIDKKRLERYRKDPESHRKRSRAWKKRNLLHILAYNRNRLAKIKKTVGTHTKYDVHRLYLKQRGKCVGVNCCVSLSEGYHVDHIKPLSRGGSNGSKNLQLLCAPCNGKKGCKTMAEWRKSA